MPAFSAVGEAFKKALMEKLKMKLILPLPSKLTMNSLMILQPFLTMIS